MEFRTAYNPRKSSIGLSPERPVLLMGSCFTDAIGERMRRGMWPVCVNPCGTLFNPLSIARLVDMALSDEQPELFEAEGLWRSWNFPATFACVSRREALASMRKALAGLREAVVNSQAAIFTLGSALVYSLVKNGSPVANCHKMPSAMFCRELWSVAGLADVLRRCIAAMRRYNPGVHVILTVSPVRHVREGFHDNALSKATLLLACRELEGECDYFPAFEILNDDLRDYRFYAEDLVHPSAVAEDYIYSAFRRTYLSAEDDALLTEAGKLRSRMEHRPLHSDTRQAAEFRAATGRMLAEFLAAHPAMRP